jgi:ArsR family transcriptional regulator
MSNSNTIDTGQTAERLKALSNPNRLRIFVQLIQSCGPGPGCSADEAGMRQCVGDLGRDLGLAPSTVSHHIKELRQAGIVRVERRGQNIHCWIDAEVVRSLTDFFQSALAACGATDAAA